MVILGTKCEAFPQMLTYQVIKSLFILFYTWSYLIIVSNKHPLIQFASIHQYVKSEASVTSSSSAPHFAELLLAAEWMDTWIAQPQNSKSKTLHRGTF